MALHTDNPAKLFLFSGIGSCIAETCTCPIDVVKVRLQLQGELGAARQYTGMFNAFTTIPRKEGPLALFKGLKPALVRQATYGSVRIGIYEPIKALYAPPGLKPGGDVPVRTKVLAGMTCGVLASGMFNPMDVMKVRMQADGMSGGAAPRYRGLTHAMQTIVRDEGLRGLYKGVSPTMQRAAIVAAVELSTYDECKQLLIHKVGLAESSVVTHFGASLMAGFMATLASSPADVIKSRVMNQPTGPDGRGLVYKSTADCLRQSVKSEGVLSLWKGFWPNFGRLGPHCVIMFMAIEQLRKAFP